MAINCVSTAESSVFQNCVWFRQNTDVWLTGYEQDADRNLNLNHFGC